MIINPHAAALVDVTQRFIGYERDPYWDYVKMLLRFEGADGGKVFRDEAPVGSPSPAWTAYGSAQTQTSVVKRGSTAGRFGVGSPQGTDWIDTPHRSELTIGAQDFCVEMWFYLLNFPADYMMLFSHQQNGFVAPFRTLTVYKSISANVKRMITHLLNNAGTTVFQCNGNWDLALNRWYHYACARHGSYARAWLDGKHYSTKAAASGTGSSWSGKWAVGRHGESPSYYLEGYIDDLRLTIGHHRYDLDEEFVPPQLELPRDSNYHQRVEAYSVLPHNPFDYNV